jgi:hypothetical protein
MTTKKGVFVRFVRQNEVEDIFHVTGNGYNEYRKFPRTMQMTEDDVLNEIVD